MINDRSLPGLPDGRSLPGRLKRRSDQEAKEQFEASVPSEDMQRFARSDRGFCGEGKNLGSSRFSLRRDLPDDTLAKGHLTQRRFGAMLGRIALLDTNGRARDQDSGRIHL
jgi:hypothetical protein